MIDASAFAESPAAPCSNASVRKFLGLSGSRLNRVNLLSQSTGSLVRDDPIAEELLSFVRCFSDLLCGRVAFERSVILL